MRPLLFTWRGTRVHSYPALLYVGMVCGVYAGYGAAASMGLDADRATLAILILFVPALVGARLWFVLLHWRVYLREPRRIWRRREGGAALMGGLVLGVASAPAVLAALDVPYAAFMDAVTFTLLVGAIFTRVGCLLNGCCAGRPTEGRLALYLPDRRGRWARRYPVQLLELATAAALLVASLAIASGDHPSGTVFVFALAGYCCARPVLNALRLRGESKD